MLVLVYFLVFRPTQKDPKQAENLRKPNKPTSKPTETTSEPSSAKTGDKNPEKEVKKQSGMMQKKPKNKCDHPYFLKSLKKNDSDILDYDISLDNLHLAIASKNRTHVLADLKTDGIIRFTTGTLLS